MIGFALLQFEFGGGDKARVNWISNAERGDMIVALKELVARFEGQPEVSGIKDMNADDLTALTYVSMPDPEKVQQPPIDHTAPAPTLWERLFGGLV